MPFVFCSFLYSCLCACSFNYQSTIYVQSTLLCSALSLVFHVLWIHITKWKKTTLFGKGKQAVRQSGRQADDMRHHNVITYCSTLSVEIWTSSRWASAYGKYAHVRGPSVFIYLCEHAKQSIESLFANHTPELKCNAFQSTTIVRTFAHTLSYRSNRIPFKIIMCARWFDSVSFLLSGSLTFAPLLFICQSVWIFLICTGESKRKETTSKSIIAFPMNVAILLVFLNCYLDFWHRFCHRQIKKIPLYAK